MAALALALALATGVESAAAAAVSLRSGQGRPAQQSADTAMNEASPSLLAAILRAKLTASDGAAGDVFGYSVALYGDTAVVAAPLDDTPAGSDAGSASVFVRSGAIWAQQAKLTASDGAAGDRFGSSVALSGDTAVVGAYGDETQAGSAYVFVRSGTTWTEQAKLTASDGATEDTLGWSVAVDGDTALVATPFDDTAAGFETGSTYVFVRSGNTWTEQAKLTASDGAGGDLLGWSVALRGDTAVVGARQDTTPAGFQAGSAYVFVRSGTTWTEQAKLTASDGAAFEDFGNSVAVAGDTAAVGARFDRTQAGSYAGSVYVFVRSGTTWTEQAKLIAPDGAARDRFGTSVAVDGDTVVAGAPGDDTPAGSDAGSAYAFVRSGTAWIERAKVTAPDGAAGDSFGRSVAVDGVTAAVGVPFDGTPAGSFAGSTWVYWG